MNHYPHHIGDFAKKTKGLSLTESGAYRELLDQYYTHEGPLSKDRRELYRMAVAATPAERKAVDYVVSKYFPEGVDGLLHNKRADEEIEAYRKRQNSASANASERWRKDANRMQSASNPQCEADAKTMPEGCGGDATAMLTRTRTSLHSSEPPTVSHPHAREKIQGGYKNSLENQTIANLAAWTTDNKACLAKASSLGMSAHPGETFQELRNRIAATEQQRNRR